jgi:hypothetical protein
MATTGIQKALEGFDRLKARIKNESIRKHIKEERGYAGLAAIAGAAIVGAADAKYREADGSSKKLMGVVPAVGAASGALAVAGLTDLIPGGVYVGMVGVGGLCYLVGKAANEHVAANAT